MSQRTISPWLLAPLALFIFMSLSTTAAHAQEQLWTTQFGSSGTDYGMSLAPDGTCGVFVAGHSYGSVAAPNAGSSDAILARYDRTGQQLWVRQFGSGMGEVVLALATDGAGGVFIAGRTAGKLGATNPGGYDAFLARFDGVGNRLWIRQFGADDGDSIVGATPDGTGGVIAVGYTWGSLSGLNAGMRDAFICRYDGDGNRLWIRQYGSSGYEIASAVVQDGSGGFMIAGETGGNWGATNAGLSDAILARYDGAGNQLWIRQFGSDGNDEAEALAPDGEGGMMVAGRTTSDLGAPHAGGGDVFVTRYDADGHQLWIRQFGSAEWEIAHDLAPDGVGGVIVTGHTRRGSLGAWSSGEHDAFVARYDRQGIRRWIRQFGTRSHDRARALVIDSVGSVMVAGSSSGDLGAPNAGSYDIFLARYEIDSCYADCDYSTGYGVLDIFDYLCFQEAFVTGCTSHQTSHRASDWVPGASHGTTTNNPSPDPLGRPAWSYEFVTGGPLGSASPWYAQPTTRMTWDEDWFGIGQGAWSQGDDTNPPIFQNRSSHSIAASTFSDIPLVRWLNPTSNPAGNSNEVDITGSLTIKWAGEGGMGRPVDVDVVIAMNDASQGTWNVLYSTTVSKPIPQPTIGDQIVLPVSLTGIALDEGDSIVITHRAGTDTGSDGRWIVLTDDVAVTGSALGCYADCDANGRLDIFDFLCFQDAFVSGCQ